MLAQAPLDTDPVYHLQCLNEEYFVLSPAEGVLMKSQDESSAHAHLHATALDKANSLAATLKGFDVLDLTGFFSKSDQNP